MQPYKAPRKTWHVEPLPKASTAKPASDMISLSNVQQVAPEVTQAPQRAVVRTVERGDGLPPILFTHPRVLGPLVVHVGSLEWGVPLGSRVARSIKKGGTRISYVLTPTGEVHVLEEYMDKVIQAIIPAFVIPYIREIYFGIPYPGEGAK